VEHHLARDLLEGYVEKSLEPETSALLEAHLATCEECRNILEGAEKPVALAPAEGQALPPNWDETRLRRTIRRTLGRLVFDVISIWVIGFVVLTIVSGFAIQPLLVNRGDRVRAAAIATWDLAVMTTPGASVEGWRVDATLIGKELGIDVVRPIGSNVEPLGTYETDLGIWRFRGVNGQPIRPLFVEGVSRTFVPDRLPEDTVATVELQWWTNPISVAEAEALRPLEGEAQLVWAGFGLDAAFPHDPNRFPGNLDYVLGYHACAAPQYLQFEDSYFSSGSAAGGGTLGCYPSDESVANALTQTRRAVDNLVSNGFLVEGLSTSSTASLRNIKTVGAWLRDHEPPVVSMVITGPTENIARLIETAQPEAAIQLDVDFWNWEG
jgi:hypothetical protein